MTYLFILLLILTVSPLILVVIIFYSFHGIQTVLSLPETLRMKDVMLGFLLIWVLIDAFLIWMCAGLFVKRVQDSLHQGELELSATSEQLKAAEEYIAYTEKKYEVLIKNMNDVVWMATPEGKVTFINESCERLLGFTPKEIMGRELLSLMCPLHDYQGSDCHDIIKQMAFEDHVDLELWMLHADGKTRKVIEVSTRRVIANGKVVEIQGVGRDITDKVFIERENKKKQEQLQVLNQMSYTILSEFDSVSMQKLYEDVCNLLVRTMDYPAVVIRSIKDQTLYYVASAGAFKDHVGKTAIELNEEQRHRFFHSQHAQASILSEKMAQSHYYQSFYENNIQHILSLPLFVEAKPFGTLTIFSQNAFDTYAVHLLEAVGYQLNLAIEKSDHIEGLRSMYVKIIDSLVTTIEAKDPYTEGHSRRVSKYAVAIAKQLNLTEEQIEEIEIAGLLHDIGKIGIADAILTKAGSLTEEEFCEIQRHPVISRKILEPIGLSEAILEGILYHHKRYDLRGYPETEQLSALPPVACIVGVADAYDAMTSNRAYKTTMTQEEVRAELKRCEGTQFCAVTVKALLDWLDDNE